VQKNIKKIIVYFFIYIIVFIVGLRAGEIYYRVTEARKTGLIFLPKTPKVYYLINNYSYGAVLSEATEDSLVFKLINDKKLKPILEKMDFEIYDENGKKVY